MKKIEIQENISSYQVKELLKFLINKLDLDVDETKENIPGNIRQHFKDK